MKIITLLLITICLINQQNQTPPTTEVIIKNAFLTWVKETNNTSKDFCTEKQCAESMKPPYPEYDCYLMLKQGLPRKKIIFEDINNDGIKDGIITADYEPCQHGTWFINCDMVGYLVFFISISETSFKVVEEPKIIRNAIGLGSVQSVKNGIIEANGADQSKYAGAHQFDITWLAKFRYKKDKFELISKTTKKYPQAESPDK